MLKTPESYVHTFIAMLVLVLPSLVEAQSRDVSMDTDLGSLAGTITSPVSGSPRAVALIISGSGPTDRDGNTRGLPGNNNSLKYLAEALAALDVASLRFDKRLVGDSSSTAISESDLRFDIYVEDALLWTQFLQEHFDAPVYIIGHSEGALVGLLVASKAEVAGVICIAGPGRRASQIIREQTSKQLPPGLFAETKRILVELENGRTVVSPPPALNSLFRESVQPYLISWFQYDPAEVAANLDMPILLLYGTTDIQIDPADGKRILESAETASLIVIDGMNHVLKLVGPERSNQIASYSDPSLPIAGELVSAIEAFIVD